MLTLALPLLALLLPSASLALTIDTPTAAQGWSGNSTVQTTWSTIAGDPSVFSVELSRPDQNFGPYNGQLAVANNVPVSAGQLTFQLPQVPPGGGYLLQFVNISDINTVYASSGMFTVAENDTVLSTTTSSSMSTMSMSIVMSSSSSGSAMSVSSASATSMSSAMSSSASMASASSTSTAPTASASTFSGASSGTAYSLSGLLGAALFALMA